MPEPPADPSTPAVPATSSGRPPAAEAAEAGVAVATDVTPEPPHEGPAPAAQDAGPGLALWLLVAGALAGIALRWFVLASPLGGFDSDEGVSALISREVSDGRFTAFIPRLKAGGTILAYPRALVLAVTGPSPVVAKLCETAVFAAACVVVWRIGRRMMSERHGQVAALLLWVFPPAMVWDSTKVRLYYTPALLLTTLGMLLALRLHRDGRRQDMAWLGLVLGLAFWTHPMALYALAPTVVWLVIVRPRVVLDSWIAVPPAIVGALPWLWFNVRNDFTSLEQPPGQAASTFRMRLEGFVDQLLPRLLGLHNQYLGDWYLKPFSYIAFAVLAALALAAAVRWRGPRTLLVAIGIGYPLLFAVPRNSVFVDEPRYGMALMPTVALCGAALVVWAARRRDVLVAVGLAVAVLVSATSLQRVIDITEPQGRALTVLRPVPTGEVWDAVRDRGVDVAYADYWLAYRLEFEDRHPLTIIPIAADYLSLTAKAPPEGARHALFYRGSPCVAAWQRLAAETGRQVTLVELDDYVVATTDQPLPVPAVLGRLDPATGAAC